MATPALQQFASFYTRNLVFSTLIGLNAGIWASHDGKQYDKDFSRWRDGAFCGATWPIAVPVIAFHSATRFAKGDYPKRPTNF